VACVALWLRDESPSASLWTRYYWFAVKIYDSILGCLSGVHMDDGHVSAEDFGGFFGVYIGICANGPIAIDLSKW
jgi:hypothetical protein